MMNESELKVRQVVSVGCEGAAEDFAGMIVQ